MSIDWPSVIIAALAIIVLCMIFNLINGKSGCAGGFLSGCGVIAVTVIVWLVFFRSHPLDGWLLLKIIGGWVGIGLGITIILLLIYLFGYGIYKIWGILHPRDSTTKGAPR